MPKEDEKILKYKLREKSLKAPFLISFENEFLLPKMSSSQNNPEKSSREKKNRGYTFSLGMVVNLFI